MILLGRDDGNSGGSSLFDCRFKCGNSVVKVGRFMNGKMGVEGKIKGVAEE